jgi:3-methyladenine DNA glycosylase AlkD
MLTADDALAQLQELADPETARNLQRFFKTGPGEYGEGDQFLGIKVPPLRTVVRAFQDLALDEVETLLHSGYHEARGLALLIWVRRFPKDDDDTREEIHHRYLANTAHVNNWDLVDASAPTLVGNFLAGRGRALLVHLAQSDSLWERRIAVVATGHFIRDDDFADTLKIVKLLLHDDEDLIHKACGWMLREVGKRDQEVLETFLGEHYATMPRTMLRYAIERFSPKRRRQYLRGEV